MFEHWLQPVDDNLIALARSREANLGHHIRHEIPGPQSVSPLVLLGIGTSWANNVRKHLYQFSSVGQRSLIIDLGNFHKRTADFILPALRELTDSGYIPILIGDRSDLVVSLVQGVFQQGENLVHVAERAGTGDIADKIHFIGLQQQICPPALLGEIEDGALGYTRLGRARSAIDELEPVIRDASGMIFDCRAIRSSDFPAQRSLSTSGFFTEEACRLTRYAGAAPGIRLIAFTGVDTASQMKQYSANTLAQIIWYFVYGFEHNVHEDLSDVKAFTQFTVQMSALDEDLVFLKSSRSGRWWLRVGDSESTSSTRSCTYNDYLMACEDQLSDRVHKIVQSSLEKI